MGKELSAFEPAILGCIQEFWPREYTTQGRWQGIARHEKLVEVENAKPYVERSVARLEQQFPSETIARLALEMYFAPSGWRPRYVDDARGRALEYILRGCILHHPAPDVETRLRARLELILDHPCGVGQEGRHLGRGNADPEAFLPPTLADCLILLPALPASPGLLRLARDLIAGDLDRQDIAAPCWEPRELVAEAWYDLLFRMGKPTSLPPRWAAKDWASEGEGRGRAYEIRATTFRLRLPAILDLLWRNRMLDEDLLLTAARHVPPLLWEASRGFSPPWAFEKVQKPVAAELAELGRGLANAVAERACEELRPEYVGQLVQLEDLRGSGFLLHAARFHAAAALDKLVYRGRMQIVLRPTPMGKGQVLTAGWLVPREDTEALVIHLAQTRIACLNQDARDELIGRLKEFPRSTLEHLLPLAQHSRPELCRALGWESAIPLVTLVVETARMGDGLPMWTHEVRSTPDPSHGVVDAGAVREAVAAAGDKVAKRVLRLFRQSGLAIGGTITLMEAAAGWNVEEIDEKVHKRFQPAIRAYGLLPLTRGDEEVLERYLFLRRFAKESEQFGMLRQGNEKAAARAGLENLARNAGYSDATRLEWSMEARLGQGLSAPRSWSIGEYEVRLNATGGDTDVRAFHGPDELTTIPSAIRKAAEYAQVKEALKELRAQRARVRASLEDLLLSPDGIRREELEVLLGMTVARPMALALLWGTPEGFFGLLDPERMELVDLRDVRLPLPERVFLVHPFHLFEKGVLGEWQRLLVHRRIEQPFKQVFRELYLVTPAEEETSTFSNRFAGRLLNSRVAGRLFQVRGWRSDPGDIALPYKIFPRHGLRASFDFPDAGHILAETDTVTTDRIYFWRHPTMQGRWPSEAEWIPLTELPPLVLSETMRDADLVVSVAQVGEGILSEEAFARRREVITALVEDLHLPSVRVEGHYAFVRGNLAAYKVQLMTAHIFIEPGGYLCVVPARWGRTHEQLFLPFPDDPDRKFSEVVSKILFLIHDDMIKDPSILKQIKRGGLGRLPLH